MGVGTFGPPSLAVTVKHARTHALVAMPSSERTRQQTRLSSLSAGETVTRVAVLFMPEASTVANVSSEPTSQSYTTGSPSGSVTARKTSTGVSDSATVPFCGETIVGSGGATL